VLYIHLLFTRNGSNKKTKYKKENQKMHKYQKRKHHLHASSGINFAYSTRFSTTVLHLCQVTGTDNIQQVVDKQHFKGHPGQSPPPDICPRIIAPEMFLRTKVSSHTHTHTRARTFAAFTTTSVVVSNPNIQTYLNPRLT